jgi:predicted AlkP superfamily pyrophosphatase or phosphodiesterase
MAACAVLAIFVACSGTANKGAEPTSIAGKAAHSAPAPAVPRLVVAVVLDQFPSDALQRYVETLDPDGPLRRAMRAGIYAPRVRFPYAGTSTGPGHAAIHTGKMPVDSGVDTNELYDAERNAHVSIVDDGKHPIFGVEGSFASPFRLMADTVADRLKAAHPDSKVLSISLKARAAVMSGGKSPDMVVWYENMIPGFVTSSYYSEQVPEWLAAFNKGNPVEGMLGEWQAQDAALYQKLLGEDSQAGEARWLGMPNTLPKDPRKSADPAKAFKTFPASIDYLLNLARAGVVEYQLGSDQSPDLLCVSISTTDYAAHAYSYESWEYIDVLRHADRELAKFLGELEKQTSIAVLITSDHGGSRLPEKLLADGKSSGRLGDALMVQELDRLLDKELGEGDWVGGYMQPFLYLTRAAMAPDKLKIATAVIEKFAEDQPGIYKIFPADVARALSQSDDTLSREVSYSVSEKNPGFFVVPTEGWIADPRRTADPMSGTGHGTPWSPDREVPLLVFGEGVHAAQISDIVDQRQVAGTLAALLGLTWPGEFQGAQSLTGAADEHPQAE